MFHVCHFGGNNSNKSSAVAEMGDYLATIDMGLKVGVCCAHFRGGAASPSNTMTPGPRPTCLPSGILIHPTVWPQYTNVSDRQDKQDRQDRQQSDSIRRTVLETVAKNELKCAGTILSWLPKLYLGRPFVKRFALCYQTVVLSVLFVLSVWNVGVLWPNGWMDQDEAWYRGRPRPRPHCVRWGSSSPLTKGDTAAPGPMSVVVKRLDGSRCHLVWK